MCWVVVLLACKQLGPRRPHGPITTRLVQQGTDVVIDIEEVGQLTRMRVVAAEIEVLRTRQRELLNEGKASGLELSAMAKALGISRQTAYGWLG